jgi:hexokinase
MPTIAAHYADDAQGVFDNIERQFQLSKESLVALTKVFLYEIGRGLANYNQPMAMM